jgi:mevalonate kinase
MGQYVPIKNLDIIVSSKIPVASGLGSSAAVTVATLGALNEEFQVGLSKDDLAFMAYQTELEVQGAASPTDTFVSTMGDNVSCPIKKYCRPSPAASWWGIPAYQNLPLEWSPGYGR